MDSVFNQILRKIFRLPEPIIIEHICETCEVLKRENNQLHDENRRLLDHILNPVKPVENTVDTSNLKPIINNRHASWPVRRQMLEAEDRMKHDAERKAAKPDIELVAKNNEAHKAEILGERKTIEELEEAFKDTVPATDMKASGE